MNIKIQHFTFLLFILSGLLAIFVWSFSLYMANNSFHQEKLKLQQLNLQLQLDKLQQAQHAWLQQRFNEVREWMENNADAQQRLQFISRYYQRYPQLRLIYIGPIEKKDSTPVSLLPLCRDLSSVLIEPDLTSHLPAVKPCLSRRQPMLGVTATIAPEHSQKLLLLMDYFSFVGDFSKLTGKNFYLDPASSEKPQYIESDINNNHSLAFGFAQHGVDLGRLTVNMPGNRFGLVWVRQAVWVIPLFLLISFALYLVLFRALLRPLCLIVSRLKKEVQTRRPGNGYDSKYLTPGLLLLHRYFMHLTHMSKHDPLTGLNNRAIFEERLQQAILEGKRSGRKYALVLVDINHFYKVNKKFGNYVGDGLLKQLANRLSGNIRESDSLARLEKDNFALLLEFSDDDRIRSLIEKIYQSVSQPYTVYGRDITVGMSFGVAIYPDHAQEMEELELKGNEALLKAHKGDWPVVFIQQPEDQTDYTGLSLIQSLHQALDNNDFKLVYQPVLDLSNHTTRYFEALLRWKQPEQHTQSIEKTIELAENNQLIKPLSQWIIQTACQQLKKMNNCDVKIAVNLSMIDFHDEQLPDRIGDTLLRSEVSPSRLMIEITEGQFMQDPDQVIEILSRLSAMGISLSIDDFGTGQASLTYLKKLPVEKLKIDQSFVKNMVEDKEDSAIVEATIQLAHTLGIEVVAEGVESAEIHKMLLDMGCDFVQGYYLSRPIEQDHIPDWIIDQSHLLNKNSSG